MSENTHVSKLSPFFIVLVMKGRLMVAANVYKRAQDARSRDESSTHIDIDKQLLLHTEAISHAQHLLSSLSYIDQAQAPFIMKVSVLLFGFIGYAAAECFGSGEFTLSTLR